ncbi:MAG: nucleotidyltransferase family protein [Candidatus Methylomirabilales bacterium]
MRREAGFRMPIMSDCSKWPELRFLLTCGRLVLGTAQEEEALTLLRLPLNWASLFEMAEKEGMGGVLAFQLRRLAQAHHPKSTHLRYPRTTAPLHSNTPAQMTQALHGIFARNGALFAELSALREGLRCQGLQVILLKGGALIETVYRGHLGLRPLSDLDLLVKPADLPAVRQLLQDRGFRPLSPSSTFFLNGSAAFDLHTDLMGTTRIRRRRLAFRFDDEALWREASPLLPSPLEGEGEGFYDPTLLVLSPPYQFLHLAVHALKHSFSRLIWFADLGLLVGAGCVKWEELVDRAEATGTLRPLAYALWGLKRLMGVKIPPEVLAWLPRLNWFEQAFLHGVVNRKAMNPIGEGLVAFSIPGLLAKLGYLLEFGFPRREVLAEIFPSTPSWFLYPRRLLQGVALGLQKGRHVVAFVKRRNER